MGLASKIIIFEVNPDSRKIRILKEINHDGRVQCLAWSPSTRAASQKYILASSGTKGGNVNLFQLAPGNDRLQIFQDRKYQGNADYVNQIAFQPDTGEQLAHGGDGGSVVLRTTSSGAKNYTFALSSPAMAVVWNPVEPSKLLVAEKTGQIHIFNVLNYSVNVVSNLTKSPMPLLLLNLIVILFIFQPILSFDGGPGPLLSADWSLKNSLFVVAAIRSEIMVWDISKPSNPVYRKTVHDDNARLARFSPNLNFTVATTGHPCYKVNILNLKSSSSVLLSQDTPVGGMSWHQTMNLMVSRKSGLFQFFSR